MSTDQEHQMVEELLGPYALDAVEPDEAEAVERHLRECPRCRAEVDDHRVVAAALGNSVEPLPANLWDRIAEQIDGAQRTAEPVPAPRLGTTRTDAPVAPVGQGSQIADLGEARRRRGRVMVAVAGAVAAAAVVVAAVLAVNLSSANSHVQRLQQAVGGVGPKAAVTAALQTPGHELVKLTTPEGVVLASMVVLPDGRGYMVSSHMPALPADETYQLWAQVDGQPISAGLLGSQPKASSGFTVASGSPTGFLVTVEPAGGVTTPDRAAVARGPVTQA